MSDAAAKKEKQTPKGGRKGGSIFPRSSLTNALSYARKLVSKTHTGPQTMEVVLTGVLGSKADAGKIRMSALKQYGLLEGDTKSNFSATELAKNIAAAPNDESIVLYRQAMLNPTIFKKLFETFHGDTVSKAKLKQRASDLNVHPDSTAICIDLYVSGMTTAELVTVVGDQVKHVALGDLTQPTKPEAAVESSAEFSVDQDESQDSISIDDSADDAQTTFAADETGLGKASSEGAIIPSPRAVFNVNVTLDSSLDIEKLQRQLELLKRFGAI